MEELNSTPRDISPVRVALKWGLISALVLILLSVISYYAGMMQSKALQWISYLLAAGGLVMAIKQHRDQLGGYITYARGLGTGVLTALFTAVFLGVFTWLFYGVIDPGAMDELLRIQEEELYNQGLSDEQIEMGLKYTTPGFIALMIVPMMTFMGFIFSLVLAAVMRRSRPMFMDEE